jgi:hypothetical protein
MRREEAVIVAWRAHLEEVERKRKEKGLYGRVMTGLVRGIHAVRQPTRAAI